MHEDDGPVTRATLHTAAWRLAAQVKKVFTHAGTSYAEAPWEAVLPEWFVANHGAEGSMIREEATTWRAVLDSYEMCCGDDLIDTHGVVFARAVLPRPGELIDALHRCSILAAPFLKAEKYIPDRVDRGARAFARLAKELLDCPWVSTPAIEPVAPPDGEEPGEVYRGNGVCHWGLLWPDKPVHRVTLKRPNRTIIDLMCLVTKPDWDGDLPPTTTEDSENDGPGLRHPGGAPRKNTEERWETAQRFLREYGTWAKAAKAFNAHYGTNLKVGWIAGLGRYLKRRDRGGNLVRRSA